MSLLTHFILLGVFSLSLATVVSAYRDDDMQRIRTGILRRSALFFIAVITFALVAYLLSQTLLRPTS